MIHLMMVTDLRGEQVERTRQRILDAVLEYLSDSHPASLSIPEISRRSGVSVATIYRHFPNKERLLEATARATTRLSNILDVEPPDPDDLAPFLRVLWSELDQVEPLVRANVGSKLGADVRRRRIAQRGDVAMQVLDLHGIDRDHPAAARLARLIATLTSSLVYLDMAGIPRDQAIADLAWAVRVLTATTRTEIAAAPTTEGDRP
jgi:AcrR family transcriptional regulator